MKKKFKSKLLWLGVLVGLGLGTYGLNFAYQVYKKPVLVLSLLDFGSAKTMKQTWENYQDHFLAHSTKDLSAEFLASLVQMESSGNPLAAPRWKFNINAQKIERFYRPSSSSFGLLQFTEGTFQEAKQYCIHDGKVVKEGRWYDWKSCWLNSLYSRVLPSQSIEMGAAYLQHHVTRAFKKFPQWLKEKRRKQWLAALVHLCGVTKAQKMLRGNFDLESGYRCGVHNPQDYIKKLENYKKIFRRLSHST